MLAMRYDNWKLVFMEQRCHGTMQVWAEPFTRLRLPKLFNLRTDPYEFADMTSNTYYDWFLHNAYFIYAAQAGAAKFAEPSRISRLCSGPTPSRSTTPSRRCASRCRARPEAGSVA